MTRPAPVDLPPMPAKTTCEVKFTDKAQIGTAVTMPFGHTDEALQAYAQLAINEALERAAVEFDNLPARLALPAAFAAALRSLKGTR